jgi:hypothetical protein
LVVSGLHRDSPHGHQVLGNQRLGHFLLAQNFSRTTKKIYSKNLADFFPQKSEKSLGLKMYVIFQGVFINVDFQKKFR